MSPLALTTKQRDAVEAPGRVTVHAGAGSGKTAVLTTRYHRALLDGLEPYQIVAVTFTEKAAAEMRERIRRDLGALATRSADEAERLARVREQLAEAPISTIHSFCAATLREFAVEAGVDPRFDVADEATTQQLRRRAVDAAIAIAADDEKHPARPPLDLLLTFYSRADVARMLGRLLDTSRYFPDETRRLLDLDEERLLAAWQGRLHEEMVGVARAVAARESVVSLRRELAALAEACTNHADALYADVQHALGLLQNLGADEERTVSSAAVLLRATLVTPDGKARRFGKTGAAASWPGDTCDRTRHTLTALGKLVRPLGAFTSPELDVADVLVAKLVRALWRLAGEVEVQYAATKGNGRVLDFDDLEERTIALLGSPHHRPVVDALRRRYRLVLVDEAQDLNLLQFRLVRLLLDTQAGSEPNAAFIVGDPQQSIFAFRNADVRLFEEFRTRALQPGVGHRELFENFRSTPALVALANRVFSELMTGGEVFDVPYGRMEAQRPQNGKSCIELLLALRPDTCTADEAQACVVAERISALVGNGRRHDLPPITYGDVAILVRTRSVIPALLDALRARAIPCAVYKGIGFYQTQEVRDVYTALRFLAGPEHDLELAGLLRSPFFGLSDDALLVLAHGRGDAPLYGILLDAPRLDKLSPTDRQALERARRLIPSWLAMVDLVPPSALLRRMLDETGAWGTYTATGAAGTINKLLRVLRALQSPAASLAQVTDLLDDHIRNVQREGDELAEAPRRNAVQIMTIHGAKGLEFPAVFVLGLDDDLTRGGRPHSIRIDADLGFAVDTPPALQAARGRSMIYHVIGERARRKELAEAKRLLYVACTRARDHLFLVGAGTTETSRTVPIQSWQRWLLDSLNLAEQVVPEDGSYDVAIAEGAVLRIVRQHPAVPGRVAPSEEPSAAARATVAEGERRITRLARALASVPPEEHCPTYSVTELLDFARCLRLHYARHVLGLRLHEEPPAHRERDEADDERFEGDQRVLGIVVHALLARLGVPTSTPLEEIAQRAARAETFDEQQAAALARRAVEIVQSFRRDARGTSLLDAEALTEAPFALRLVGGALRGRIDRLVSGEPPLIADFKLPRQPAVATRESLHAEYGLQLRAYALAASRLLGADTVRAAIALPETRVVFEWRYDGRDFPVIERELVECIRRLREVERPASLASLAGCGECVVCRSLPSAPAIRA